MNVRMGKLQVSVAFADCGERDCFQLGFDKGTFVQGRGYVSYRAKERPVCMTRHLRGCPTNSVCPNCRTLSARHPGEACDNAGRAFRCPPGSVLVAAGRAEGAGANGPA